jgi:hypothetical protein
MTDKARSFDCGPIVAFFVSTGASMLVKINYARAHLSCKESQADPELSGGEKQIKFFIDSHLIKYLKSAKLVELK